MTTRNCGNKDCKQINPQPISAFRKRNDRGNRVRSQCKSCLNDKARSYYSRNNEQIKVKLNSNEDRKAKKRVYHSRPRTKEQARARNLKTLYNLSVEQFDSMLSQQNDCCKICGRHKSEFKKPLHVDHCPKTGPVRGLLCNRCNLGLGMFEDNPVDLRNAAKYLEAFYAKMSQTSKVPRKAKAKDSMPLMSDSIRFPTEAEGKATSSPTSDEGQEEVHEKEED